MKKLLIGLAILAILLTGAWYGAETWLSRVARDALAGQPEISAEVTPLRQPGRLGLHLQNIEIAGAQAASMTGLDGYVRLRSPATLTIDLPEVVSLAPANAAPSELVLTDGRAEVTLSPTRGLAVRYAGVSGHDLVVNGAALFDSLNATATLTHMGGAAPDGSAAAYRVDLAGDGLVVGALPETLDILGAVQVWLNAVPDRAALDGSAALPQPTGLQTQALVFTLGDMTARLAGRVEADAEGLATGQAAIYTSDGPAFIQASVEAGILPQDLANPLLAVVTAAAGEPATAEPEPVEQRIDSEILASEAVTLPRAKPGEIRLPLFMQDGIIRLGPVPLGPAPRISGF